MARTHHAAVGVEFVRRLRNAVKIELGADLGTRPPGTDHGRDDRFDLIAQVLLETQTPLVDADVTDIVAVGGAVGQQVAGFVDDRNSLRLEPVNGGGDEMTDGTHLLSFQGAVDLDHDRRRRLDLVSREQRAFRHHQVHACGDHPVDAADSARELTFESAQIIDVLHEARRAQRVRFVEYLVTDAAALRQPLSGKRHS